MNKKRIRAFLMVSLFLSGSCSSDVTIDSPEKELFMEKERIGFYVSGEPVFLYAESLHQKAENPARGVFRFQTDVQDTCLNVIYESEPRNVGVHVLIDLDYMEPRERISSGYQFECSKITGSRVWFWDSETKYGIIVPGR